MECRPSRMRRAPLRLIIVAVVALWLGAGAAPAIADDKPPLEIPSRSLPQAPETIAPPPAPVLSVSESVLAAKATPLVGTPRMLPCAGRWLPLFSESFECARAAFARGDFAEAARGFSDAGRYVRDQESRELAAFWEAESLWKLRRFSDAAWPYKEVLTSARTPTKWMYYGFGWAAIVTGAFEEAVPAFVETTRGRPEVPMGSAYLGLGFAYYGAKQWGAAVRAWDAAERVGGEVFPADALFWKAQALAQLGNVEAATRELQRFVASSHDRVLPSAHAHLGWSLLATGRPAEAIPSLRAAANESTGAEKAWAIAALARALRVTGRSEDLVALAKSAMTGAEIDGWLALSGAVLSAGRDDKQAEALFALARTHAPRDDVARYATLELAKLRLKSGRFRDVIAALAPFAPADEIERHVVTLIRAEAQYALSDYARALADYQTVLRAGVIKVDRLLLAVAWATLRAGDPLAAGKHFLAFAANAPKDPEADPAIMRAARIAVDYDATGALFKDVVALARERPEAFAVLREAADHGHPLAMYHVAQAYEAGHVVARDFAEAARWYRRASEKGQADAQLALASLYEIGLGLPRDDGEAVKWYRRAAANGIAAAQFELGIRHDFGRGFPKNHVEAVRWYRRAADQGLAAAEHYLGLSYAIGDGVHRDLAEAAAWYRRAAVRGYAAAQHRLGMAHRLGVGVRKDDVEAVRWLRAAAENGHVAAQVLFGYLLMNGDGVMNDDRDAAQFFARAAEAGDAAGQYFFGLMLETGRGVRANPALAAQWYRRAADAGNLDAQVALGFLHEEGRGVVKDTGLALGWYLKAARAGNTSAQVNLGTMHYRGYGVVQDYNEAIRWWRAAAQAGDGDAQMRLAKCYQGGCGAAADPVQAHLWFNLAASRLSGGEQQKAIEGREASTKFMTPAQVAEAQQLARRWTPPRERQPAVPTKTGGLEVASAGTGFFVDRTGFIVTAAKSIEGCVKLRARNSVHEAAVGARLVAVDKAHDLALMRAANGWLGGAPIQNVNVATQTTAVRSFLEGQRVELEPVPRAAGTVDLAERARRLAVFVECVK